MKSALEDIARKALGLNPPAPPAKRAANRTPAQEKRASPLRAASATRALEDEQFRVFELAYGSGATLVLSAHTDGPAAQQKFVTLIAQPDLYGNVLVLLKSVTDGAHLDDKPRMRLVDAVDAMADNRGELLFELRGATAAPVRSLPRAARPGREALCDRRRGVRSGEQRIDTTVPQSRFQALNSRQEPKQTRFFPRL